MRKITKLIAALLATTMAVMPLSNYGTVTYASQTTEVVDVVSERMVSTEGYPSSLDLSESEYFPGIGDQGSNGNCFYYATFYMNLTYAKNKALGQKTTEENTINPMFGFNYAPLTEGGAYPLVEQIGFATLGAIPLDPDEHKSLYPTKEVWESAIFSRAGEMQSIENFGTEDNIVKGPTDSSLNQIKHTLNEGLLVSCGVLTAMWNYSEVSSGVYKGEKAIDRCDAKYGGGHVVVIVGYDDSIWIDINHDGKVQEAELGAFKVANSWGTDWGNDGFVWVAYDAPNVTSQILTSSDQTRINKAIDAGTIKGNKVNNSARKSFFMFTTYTRVEAKERITSDCLCYMTVNTGSRKEMTMSVTATHKKNGTKKTYEFPKLVNEKKHLAWDGTVYSTDGTMVFDLDNVIPDISGNTMEDYLWEVTFEDDTLDGYALTVKDVYFAVEGSKKYTTTVSKVPLNGSKRTYAMNLRTADSKEEPAITAENQKNVTIYYSNSNYKDANIHYRVGSGTWTTAPGVQMCVDNEQSGYTWKYVVNLGTNSSLTACFNNGAGTWDNNNTKDYTLKAGCYGIKNGVITELQEVEDTPDPFIELEEENLSLYVNDETTIQATVIDGKASDIVWTSSDEAVATVSADGTVRAVGKGTATITAKIGDVSASCKITVEEPQIPLAGTLTVDGSKVALTKDVGSSITLDAAATGGSGSYTYKFAVCNEKTGVWTILQDFSDNSSYTTTLKTVGAKQFAVTIKDSTGATVATNRIRVVTKNPVEKLSATLKVNGHTATITQNVGSKVTLEASATGGSGNYTYKFAVYNETTGNWFVLKDFSSTSTYTSALSVAGGKQFAVTVKDSTGATVSTNRIRVVAEKMSVKLEGTLKADGKTESFSTTIGTNIILDASATGGSGSYMYKFAVLDVKTGSWTVIQYFGSETSCLYAVTSAGTKQFAVTVKDSNGNTVATNRVTVSMTGAK